MKENVMIAAHEFNLHPRWKLGGAVDAPQPGVTTVNDLIAADCPHHWSIQDDDTQITPVCTSCYSSSSSCLYTVEHLD